MAPTLLVSGCASNGEEASLSREVNRRCPGGEPIGLWIDSYDDGRFAGVTYYGPDGSGGFRVRIRDVVVQRGESPRWTIRYFEQFAEKGKDGVFLTFRKNRKPWNLLSYREGARDGVWIEFNQSGRGIKLVSHCENGEIRGPFQAWEGQNVVEYGEMEDGEVVWQRDGSSVGYLRRPR